MDEALSRDGPLALLGDNLVCHHDEILARLTCVIPADMPDLTVTVPRGRRWARTQDHPV